MAHLLHPSPPPLSNVSLKVKPSQPSMQQHGLNLSAMSGMSCCVSPCFTLLPSSDRTKFQWAVSGSRITFTTSEMEPTHQGRAHSRGALGWAASGSSRVGGSAGRLWQGKVHKVTLRFKVHGTEKKQRDKRIVSRPSGWKTPDVWNVRTQLAENQNSPDLPESGACTKWKKSWVYNSSAKGRVSRTIPGPTSNTAVGELPRRETKAGKMIQHPERPNWNYLLLQALHILSML